MDLRTGRSPVEAEIVPGATALIRSVIPCHPLLVDAPIGLTDNGPRSIHQAQF